MPRPSRHAVLGDGNCAVHLTIRAHNRQFLFRDPEVKQLLFHLLLKHKSTCQVKIHHYVFLDNHIHLVLQVENTASFSRFMQAVFGSLNRRQGRSGRVFGERARTPVIQQGRHFLTVMRYIDLNPVRAGIVAKAHHYPWSSYRHYAFGEANQLIDDAPEYERLGRDAVRRRQAYREVVSHLALRGEQRLPQMTTWYFIGSKNWVVEMAVKNGLLRTKKPPGS
jgi:putative transposase